MRCVPICSHARIDSLIVSGLTEKTNMPARFTLLTNRTQQKFVLIYQCLAEAGFEDVSSSFHPGGEPMA